MESGDVVLLIEEGTDAGHYRFTCPKCENLIEKFADYKVIRLLESAGVPIKFREESDESEKPTHAGPPPITIDDVIDFHEGLTDEALAEWLS